MNLWRLAVTVITVLLPVWGHAANPFLDAKNDQPVLAKFRGTEWSDDIGEEEISVTARVVTARIAKVPWVAIFKIEFTDLKSHAEKQRQIRPEYFTVTDNRIVLLNEEDNDADAKGFRQWKARRNSNQTTFTVSPAAASNTKKASEKRQSN